MTTQSTTCTRRGLLAATGIGWFLRSTRQPAEPTELFARTVVIVRHAEKESGEDPELSEAGRVRATRLAEMFAAAGVTALHTTDYRRNRQTLEPMADKLGLDLSIYSAKESEDFAKSLAAPLDRPSGGTVVIAGHSNTVPAMVAALGGELAGLSEKGWLEHDDYDRVVILTLCGAKGQPLRAVSTVDLRMEI